MKKILCFLTVFALVFSLCACGSNGTNSTASSSHGIDVAYYASLGKIPELKFALGANPDDILNAANDQENAEESSDEHHHLPSIIKQEGNLSVLLDAGDTRYYYEKSKSENGVSAIVCLNGAYGFLKDSGETITAEKIKSAISVTCEEKTPTKDDLFFLPITSDNAKVLIYIFNNKYKLQFFFIDGVFSAVMLSDIENWTI